MRFLDRLRGWLATPAAPPIPPADRPPEPPSSMPPEIARVDAALRGVEDPEFGVDIVNMGLVRAIEVGADRACRVRMTLTTPGCPVAPFILGQVEKAIRSAGFEPEVTLEFDPPWTPADLTPEGRAKVEAR